MYTIYICILEIYIYIHIYIYIYPYLYIYNFDQIASYAMLLYLIYAIGNSMDSPRGFGFACMQDQKPESQAADSKYPLPTRPKEVEGMLLELETSAPPVYKEQAKPRRRKDKRSKDDGEEEEEEDKETTDEMIHAMEAACLREHVSEMSRKRGHAKGDPKAEHGRPSKVAKAARAPAEREEVPSTEEEVDEAEPVPRGRGKGKRCCKDEADSGAKVKSTKRPPAECEAEECEEEAEDGEEEEERVEEEAEEVEEEKPRPAGGKGRGKGKKGKGRGNSNASASSALTKGKPKTKAKAKAKSLAARGKGLKASKLDEDDDMQDLPEAGERPPKKGAKPPSKKAVSRKATAKEQEDSEEEEEEEYEEDYRVHFGNDHSEEEQEEPTAPPEGRRGKKGANAEAISVKLPPTKDLLKIPEDGRCHDATHPNMCKVGISTAVPIRRPSMEGCDWWTLRPLQGMPLASGRSTGGFPRCTSASLGCRDATSERFLASVSFASMLLDYGMNFVCMYCMYACCMCKYVCACN